MAIDLTKPVFILAAVDGERLAIMGGSNDFEEARLAAALSPSLVLLAAVPLSGGPDQLRGRLADMMRAAAAGSTALADQMDKPQ